MTRLDRYLIANILMVCGIVGLALTSIYTFTTFVSDLDDTGAGFGLWQLLVYTLMNLPGGLQVLLPIIAMLGTLMGLGNLAGQGEITAIRAAGVSRIRIGVAALMAGVIVGVFGWVLGDWIAPQLRQSAERYRSAALHGVDAGVGLKPVWLRDGNEIFNIRQLQSEDRIGNTVVYSLADDLHLRAVTVIDKGEYDKDHWTFSGVRRTEFGEHEAQVETQDLMDWRGGMTPRVLRLFVLEARSLSTQGLIQLIAYLRDNELDSSAQQLALWRKLVAPLTVMVMMLFAVPFIFGSLRNSGAGLRLMIGVLVGVGFYVTNEVTASMGQLYGWPPYLSASVPTAVLAVLGWWRLAVGR